MLAAVLHINGWSQTDTEFWFVAPEITRDHYYNQAPLPAFDPAKDCNDACNPCNDPECCDGDVADDPFCYRGGEPIFLVLTTSNLPSDVTISMPANPAFPVLNYPIADSSTLEINLTTLGLQSEVENMYASLDGIPGKSDKGIYIEATNPITAYYEVRTKNNCDIFALKGENALGTEFYGVFQNYGYNMSGGSWVAPAYSSMDIVATADGTRVDIEYTQPHQHANGYVGNFFVMLDKGETLSLFPTWTTDVPTSVNNDCSSVTYGSFANDILFGRAGPDHLSGIRVTSDDSDKPIAVTKKDDSVRFKCIGAWTGGCYDLIGDQMVPLHILGKEYIAMKGGLTSAPENLYIVATEDNTDIFIDGAGPVINIDQGETYMYEFWASGNNFVHVRGDKKISVLHVSGFGCEVGGAILPPTDKCTGSTQVGFTRSTDEGFFLNIMVWNGAQDAFYLNGVLQVDGGGPGVLFGPSDFQAIPGSANWLAYRSANILDGGGYCDVGVQTVLENKKDVFHLGVINGGSSSGCRFGYFSDFNELEVNAEASGSGTGEIRACGYDQIQLYAQGGTTFDWWPAEYLNDPSISIPVADPPAGTTTLFYVEVSGACGLTDTASVTVLKFPHVEAQFSIDRGNGCSPLDIIIHETSTQIYERFWNFNFSGIGGIPDNDTILYTDYINRDTDTTFAHIFVNTTNEADPDSIQNYEVRLLVKNSNDCVDTAYASVIVYPEVTADFTLTDLNDTIGCSPLLVQYVDNSNNEDFYYWKFGDGVSGTIQNPIHEFNNILNSDTVYNTELIVRSIHFCRDTLNLDITLYPYLEAGFTIDVYEGCSPLDVTFATNTVFEDSIVLVYGDGNTLNASSLGSVLHTYQNTSASVDTNAIELHVFNDEGCEKIWYDTVIVFPEVTADYTVDGNNYTGCNSRTVTLTNTSTMGVHTASEFLWSFGDGTNSNLTNPAPHLYDNISLNDKNYNFNLHSESQYGCFDDTANTITIYRAYADFTVDVDEGCSPLDVAISNISEGNQITTWNWNFGDATNSALQNPPVKTYTNISGATQIRNMQLTVTGTNGCSTSEIKPISVFSSVDLTFNPLNQTGCDSLEIAFNSTIVPNIASTTYLWNFGDGTSSGVADPTHIYRNLTDANAVTYPVNIGVQTPEGCTDAEITNITVRPYVNAKFTVDKVIGCSPLTVDAIATEYIGIPAANYVWTFGDPTPPFTGYNPPAHIYPVNPPGANDSWTLRLDVSDPSGNCTDFSSKIITVYDEALADFNPKNSIDCNPYTLTFVNASLNADTYQWDFDDLTTSSDPNPTHTFINNNIAANKIYDVELEVTSDEGCTDVINSNVNVYPFVKADFGIDFSEGCSPLTVTITNNSSVGASGNYSWYWDDTDNVVDSTISSSSFTKDFTHSTGANRLYKLKLVVDNGNGCKDSLTRDITVFSSLNAQFTFNQPDSCNQSYVEFTNTTLYSNNYKWDFGDGTSVETSSATVSKTFTNNTPADFPFTINLTAESAEGCSDNISDIVTVYSLVEADFNINVSEGCSPVQVTFTNNSIGNEFFWFWNDDDLTLTNADSTIGAASFLKTFKYNGGGTRKDSITLIVGNGHGCYKTIKKAFSTHSSIDAEFTFSQPDSCNQSVVVFTNTTAYASKYKWNFGDGTSLETTSNTVPKTFTNNTTNDYPFTVNMTAESAEGCVDAYSDVVTVYSRLIAGFSVPSSQGCPPFASTIINTSIGNAANTYRWYIDGVQEYVSVGLSDFTHTYDNVNPAIRNYIVRMETTNIHGCTDDTTATIIVYEYIDAQFAFDDADGCTPHLANIDNQTLAPATNTNYFWTFGDASSSSLFEPSHSFVNASRTTDKTFRVNLSVTSENYCTDTISHVITSYHQPLAKLYVSETSSCPPLDVTMNNFDSKGFDSFEWRFGDGNTSSSNPESYSYPNPTIDNVYNYTLKLWTGTNEGCTHMDSTVLNVFPDVIADFTIDNNADCSPHVAEFMNASSSPATQFYWNFDDGGTETKDTVFHRFVNNFYNDHVFDVLLTASSEYNCWDTITKPVTVYAQPTALFNPTPTVQTFPEARVWLNNGSNDGPWDYLWELDDLDQTTLTNSNLEFYNYGHWGVKNIKLTLNSQTSYCADDITKTVTIYPPEVNAAFETNIDGGCLDEGLDVQFTAAASIYSEVYNYTWDFGDGSSIVTGSDITHTYESPGVFYVKMTATGDGGEDFEYKTIRVYSNPDAKFEVLPKIAMLDEVNLEARIEFYNLSVCNDTAGCYYLWDFGDGSIDTTRKVTHAYSPDPEDLPIKYDISLLVTTANGCADSLTLFDEVEVIGAGQIAFPNAFTPNEDGLNDTFRPVSQGVIKYELLVYNRWGELIFTTKDLSVGWDGTINGEFAKPDVYVWKAQGKFTNGRSFELAGDITLIR